MRLKKFYLTNTGEIFAPVICIPICIAALMDDANDLSFVSIAASFGLGSFLIICIWKLLMRVTNSVTFYDSGLVVQRGLTRNSVHIDYRSILRIDREFRLLNKYCHIYGMYFFRSVTIVRTDDGQMIEYFGPTSALPGILKKQQTKFLLELMRRVIPVQKHLGLDVKLLAKKISFSPDTVNFVTYRHESFSPDTSNFVKYKGESLQTSLTSIKYSDIRVLEYHPGSYWWTISRDFSFGIMKAVSNDAYGEFIRVLSSIPAAQLSNQVYVADHTLGERAVSIEGNEIVTK